MSQPYQEDYKIPKAFFTNERYRHMSNNAKMLYVLLIDRMEADMEAEKTEPGTLKKGKNGAIYINFPGEEVGRLLHVGHSTVSRLFKELESANLIERRRRGLGKPDDIYVGKIAEAYD